MSSAREKEFAAYVAAGRTAQDAAAMAGYARPARAAQRLLARGVGALPKAEPIELDPATRLERTLERLDRIVTAGEDRDAVSAAKPLIDEARQLLEQRTSSQQQVWFIHVGNGRAPMPEPSEHVLHVYGDAPSIDAVLARLHGIEAEGGVS